MYKDSFISSIHAEKPFPKMQNLSKPFPSLRKEIKTSIFTPGRKKITLEAEKTVFGANFLAGRIT